MKRPRKHLRLNDYKKLIKQHSDPNSYAVREWFKSYKKYGGKLSLVQIRNK